MTASKIATWDGTSWSALTRGMNGRVRALAEYDDGGGPALFAGGGFTTAGGAPVDRVARWDGMGWTELGSGTNAPVSALTVYDDGSGPALYAGGEFTTAGGEPAEHIARWDGTSWTALGSGLNDSVLALAAYDDGGGPELYAAGSFTTAGGDFAHHVARWDGTSWSPLGLGTSGDVHALTVYDDGGGSALYAGGDFSTAGGGLELKPYIARWDGTSWSALGSGMDNIVYALTVYDDGTGPALYAGGDFRTAGGLPAIGIARWDGTTWSAFGGVFYGEFEGDIRALTVYDDGAASALYVGGGFWSAGGMAANYIARWDGTTWSALGGGMDNIVLAMAPYDDGSGAALYAGGQFTSASGSRDSFLAFWGCDTTPPVLACPPVFAGEFNGPPGEVVHFSIAATDDHDRAPEIVCTPPSGSFFPRGTTLVTCTATDDHGNESTCQFPVMVVLKTHRQPSPSPEAQ